MVLIAVLSMLVLGVLFGFGLVIAARKLRVDEDPRLERALDALPGVNCGGCGYGGCRAYAEAVVGSEKVTLCTAGGPDTAGILAELMGVEVGEMVKMRAVVHCQGGVSQCADTFQYVGEQDCRAAQLAAGGPKACIFGCLGFGTCAAACPYGAIVMSEERLPVVDVDKCTGCGLCVRSCPRGIISLLPAHYTSYLGCSSHYRGKSVKDICSVGCIGCGLCAKKDANGAIEMVDNLPVLDFEKAGGDFAQAAEVCPTHSYVVEGPEAAPAEALPAEQQAQPA